MRKQKQLKEEIMVMFYQMLMSFLNNSEVQIDDDDLEQIVEIIMENRESI